MRDGHVIATLLEKTSRNALLEREVNELMEEGAACIRKLTGEVVQAATDISGRDVEILRLKARLKKAYAKIEELEERIAIMTEPAGEFVDPEWPPMEVSEDD